MFFTPDLLAQRESGFGLLWLAATLGSKSTFKRLPKRSVLTADIQGLCDLITEPIEPLALRLSSNLMVGVARVYKVKQDIFLTDVTHCVASLKKMVEDLHSTSATATSLQMAQPALRVSALNLTGRKMNTDILDFDALVADWNDFLNINNESHEENGDDQEYNLNQERQPTTRRAPKPSSGIPEEVRADLCTLKEDHDHFLADFRDFTPNLDQFDPSSSQASFGFLDIPQDNMDGFDLGIIGDELAQELGEGWGASPFGENPNGDIVDAQDVEQGDMNMDFAFDLGLGPIDEPMPEDVAMQDPFMIFQDGEENPPATPKRNKRSLHDANKENVPPSALSKQCVSSPVASFSKLFLSQDDDMQPLADDVGATQKAKKPRKKKTTRLLLDARTQLTDDELKQARSQYVETQNVVRRELLNKQMEKANDDLVNKLLWAPPANIQSQVLIDFWKDNFKVQVEARSGAVTIHDHDEPPQKRRKLHSRDPTALEEVGRFDDDIQPQDFDAFNFNDDMEPIPIDMDDVEKRARESSDEPGQARGVSRPSSAIANHFPISQGDSQLNSFFPWDHAGSSSSNEPFGGDMFSAGRLSDISYGRKSSIPSGSPFNNNISVAVPPSSPLQRGESMIGEDFAFPIAPALTESQVNHAALERNSLNFLEYSKMQYQALPPGSRLSFDDIIPKTSSTRRIAASAFYHCLMLATKDQLRLDHSESSGNFSLKFNN